MTAEERPFGRRAWLALIALCLACAASLPWLVHPWFDVGDETNDAAMYVACARALRAGEGYSYLEQPLTVRPPGMSVLIAPLVDPDGTSYRALNLLVAASGIACVALLFVHARQRIGDALALLLAGAVWFSDPFQRLCNQVMSDVPGAALVLLCLAVERWAARRPGWRRSLVLGICIGASTYVRSVVILLVPAIALAQLLQRWRDRGAPDAPAWLTLVLTRIAPIAVAAFLVKLPWDVRCALHHPELPVDQNFVYTYSTGMWHEDAGDPSSPRRELGDILARVPQRARSVLGLLGSGLVTREGPAVFAGAALVALALVPLVRRRASAELFALAAAGVLLVYFGFRDRLVLPVWILLLPAAIEGLLTVARPWLGARGAAALAAVPLLLLPALAFRPRAEWDEIRKRHEFHVRLAADVASAVPAGDRIATNIGWHLSVFLARPVWSLYFAARRAGGSAGLERVLERYAIDAVVLAPRSLPERALVPWAEQRCGAPLVAGEALVFRVPR